MFLLNRSLYVLVVVGPLALRNPFPKGSIVTQDEKLEMILKVAHQSGFTVDSVLFLMSGLDDKAIAILLGNVSRLPKYMKSKEIPYLSRSRTAPSMEMRKSPLSH